MASSEDDSFCGGNIIDETNSLNFSEYISTEEQISGFTIEYDDDAILAFNPALRDDLGKHPVANYAQEIDSGKNEGLLTEEETLSIQNCNQDLSFCKDDRYVSDTEPDDEDIYKRNIKIKNSLSCGGIRADTHEAEDILSNDKHVLASGDMAFGCERAVERLTRVMVARIQSRIPQLHYLKQELAQMQADVKILKEEYSEIDNMCRKASSTQTRLLKTARSYIHNLDLVIYQNKVINHLDNAEKQMKLFECQVTPDKRIILVDPDSLGTDVDKPSLHLVNQNSNLID